VGITGLVITKLDGTARGGVVVSIVRDVGVPVKLIGVGEGIKDLRDFEPALFVDALLGYEVRVCLFGPAEPLHTRRFRQKPMSNLCAPTHYSLSKPPRSRSASREW
jgi:signal recognition particle GTPase